MCYFILPSFIHNNSLKLSGLAIMLLLVNQFTADSYSFSSVWRRSVKLLQVTAVVLSSAKLCISDIVSYKNKPFIKMLNRIGPSIEPCGTPESIVLKKLNILLIFTLCFWCFE